MSETGARYQLHSEKQISPIFECENCNGWYHIELRRYKDMQNTNNDNLVETSVRTACKCIKEVDPFLQANIREPYIVDVNRGIPEIILPNTIIDIRSDRKLD